jgi:hypothetical protein
MFNFKPLVVSIGMCFGIAGIMSAYAPQQSATLPTDHPVQLDRTGIAWVLPFELAQSRSNETGHPLLIKAVAFGTTVTGCW